MSEWHPSFCVLIHHHRVAQSIQPLDGDGVPHGGPGHGRHVGHIHDGVVVWLPDAHSGAVGCGHHSNGFPPHAVFCGILDKLSNPRFQSFLDGTNFVLDIHSGSTPVISQPCGHGALSRADSGLSASTVALAVAPEGVRSMI